METLKKTLFVPANHRFQIDIALPESFPMGEAEVILVFAPKQNISRQNEKDELLNLAGKLKDSEHFNEDPLALQKELRDEWSN